MTHEEVLNEILATSCGNPLDGEDEGWNEYSIQLHCAAFSIVARCLNPGEAMSRDDTPFRYEIKRIIRE